NIYYNMKTNDMVIYKINSEASFSTFINYTEPYHSEIFSSSIAKLTYNIISNENDLYLLKRSSDMINFSIYKVSSQKTITLSGTPTSSDIGNHEMNIAFEDSSSTKKDFNATISVLEDTELTLQGEDKTVYFPENDNSIVEIFDINLSNPNIDESEYRYSIRTSLKFLDDMFRIDGKTGKVYTTGKSFDYELVDSYDLIISFKHRDFSI
ncbi:hypothetical protein ThvES_00021220, partial [Thiovulum sp. ES]